MNALQLLRHNFELAKFNAQISMTNYRITGKHFYLQFAIEDTCRALKMLKNLKGEAR